MHIIDNYIKQIFPGGALFSDTFSRLFTLNSSNLLELNIDHSDQNARGIIVHSVIIVSTTNAVTHNLVDEANNIIIRFGENTSVTGIYQVNHYINSGRIKLTLQTIASAGVHLTAQYQYIYDVDKKAP